MKRCFKCGRLLPLEDFYLARGMKDGHCGKCKACTRADVAERRQTKIDEVRAYDRARGKRPERKLQQALMGRRRAMNFPEKVRARAVVRYHVRIGDLAVQPCECCGRTTDVHAHHDDYTRPLDVRWLCPPCHSAVHRGAA